MGFYWFGHFLFFLVSLAKGLFILLIFSNNQPLASLIFFFFLVSILFTSTLIFMISFLWLTIGFVCFFSVAHLGVRLGCLFDVFLISWGKLVLLLTSYLELLLLHPIGFRLSCCYLLSLGIYFLFDFFSDSLVVQ